MKKNKKWLGFWGCFLTLLLASWVYGLNTINLVDGGSAFIDLSLKNLNLIKFPIPGIKVYTSSKFLDIKVDEENVFVKFIDETILSPQEVFFIVPSGEVFNMVFVPKEIPSQTVVVRMSKEDITDALEWETSHSYVSGLKDLIKAMYEGRPPKGFSVKEVEEEKPVWKEAKITLKQVYRGATLQGEVYEVVNITKEPIRFVEKEFYEKGVLAVSLDRHELKPGEKTELYLVKKTKAQREFEKVLKKTNPLDVLRGEK